MVTLALSQGTSWAVIGAAGAAGALLPAGLWWWATGSRRAYDRRLDASIARRHRSFTGGR